jgi:hypothetical protein
MVLIYKNSGKLTQLIAHMHKPVRVISKGRGEKLPAEEVGITAPMGGKT